MVVAAFPTVQGEDGRANGIMVRLKVSPDHSSDNEQTLGWILMKAISQILTIPHFSMAVT